MNTNLNTKSVQFAGRTLIVSQASLRMNLRMLELSEAASNELTETVSVIEAHFRVEVYPKMAACTTTEDGAIPTVEEFLDGSELETNDWYLAAAEMNPHWFPGTMTEAEKKKRRRSKRTFQSNA